MSFRVREEPTSLIVDPSQRAERSREAAFLPSWDLDPRCLWDLELLLNGAFSPLRGFLDRKDYEGVRDGMRLSDGTLWPIPINLDVTEGFAETLSAGDRISLRHPDGVALAILNVGDVWRADKESEAKQVFGTLDPSHPGVAQLNRRNPIYVGGVLEGIESPQHHTFRELRHTPSELREEFRQRGWERVVAFQTRNPLHRAHVEMTTRAMREAQAALLLHPVVGQTSPGDIDYFSRVRCYQAVSSRYPEGTSLLSLLPLAMRMGGPREAVWHAIIRANYGCTHFIVGRDHAGPRNRSGQAFYGPLEARDLAREYGPEMGIEILGFEEMVYCEGEGGYVPRSEVREASSIRSISGTELRDRLRQGGEIPDWFSYPEVVEQLRAQFPDRSRQGFTVFFTGLSGAGKSTIANILVAKLMEIGTRPVTLLDGDIVRKNLSSELGFSREHRDLNIQRIGFVASEITKNRGVAICAPIAPYHSARAQVRELVEGYGGFVEVHVSTPLEVCEQRDRKGLYTKARAGLIKGFTGIDDPYEVPEKSDLEIDTSHMDAESSAQEIVDHLRVAGFLTTG